MTVLTTALVVCATACGFLSALVCLHAPNPLAKVAGSGLWVPPVWAAAGAAGVAVTGDGTHSAGIALAGLLACFLVARRAGGLTVVGVSFFLGAALLMVAAAGWALGFVLSIPISLATRSLLLLGVPFAAPMLVVLFVQQLEAFDPLVRRRWTQPRSAPLGPVPRIPRRVSIHVPVHAEPSELVIGTLDRLAALDYPNYEVMVIDNNTADEALWHPVEEHCRRLGRKFRFLHVEGLAGAKAGALNYALGQTAEDVELIAIVDADYHAEPNFLNGLVGAFEDPAFGFVQTPHDYRTWGHNPYLRACYWEYHWFYKTTLPTLNEHGAPFTVGTMCMLRRAALERAGGWAEWCLTEDSELATRIHALGYRSLYLTTTMGRGLIPDTFAGYRRQRFRWTYGPVQEFKRHWRLFLPGSLARPSLLTPRQKLHHFVHGFDGVAKAVGVLMLPLGLAVVASIVAHREAIPVPVALWITATVTLLSTVALRLTVYRAIVGARLGDSLRGLLASAALGHIIMVACVLALFGRRAAWRRTDKRASSHRSPSSALGDVLPEILIAGPLLAGAAAAMTLGSRSGLVVMLGIGLGFAALGYFATVFVALWSNAVLGDASPERPYAGSSEVGAAAAVEATPVA